MVELQALMMMKISIKHSVADMRLSIHLTYLFLRERQLRERVDSGHVYKYHFIIFF